MSDAFVIFDISFLSHHFDSGYYWFLSPFLIILVGIKSLLIANLLKFIVAQSHCLYWFSIISFLNILKINNMLKIFIFYKWNWEFVQTIFFIKRLWVVGKLVSKSIGIKCISKNWFYFNIFKQTINILSF